MKRRSKTIVPCNCLKMGLLMRFLFLTFIGRAIALASSIASPETTNTTRASLMNGNNGIKSNYLNSRKSRAVHSESDESSQISEGTPLEESYFDEEITQESKLEDFDKRSIPMMRFGRSGASMIPTVRFGRSGSSVIPTIRFGRSDASMIPTVRFGRSDSSMIPTIRFGRSESSMIPAMRFGRSESSMIPGMRFGRSESSVIPTIRFGRSDSSMIPSIRFGRSSKSMIPSVRFGRTDNSMIPIPRFGRTYQKNEDSDEDNKMEDIDSIIEQQIQKSEEDVSKINSDEVSLDFISRNSKRESNDSLIPQIRYGRSSLKSKTTKVVKPLYFSLPNIRPGRSSNDYLNTPEETNEPYISEAQGFLGLFGAFRRSDEDIIDDSRNLEDMELGKKVKGFLLDANTNNPYKDLEKQSQLSNQDTLYVIPYPRPGKRQLKMYSSLQKNIENTNEISSPNLSKVNKISNFLVPYPRPGKKRQGNGPLNYEKLQKPASILPYPRPGRSNIMLPYPRPGRSMTSVPYPRPGRSSKESGSMLPYPRYGKSKDSLDSESDNKSAQDNEPAYILNPLLAEKMENFKKDLKSVHGYFKEDESKLLQSDDLNNLLRKQNSQETNNNPIFMLPYPRPGRHI